MINETHDVSYAFKAREKQPGVVQIIGVGTCTRCQQQVAVDGEPVGSGAQPCESPAVA
jgi:hypothetical protein